MDTLPLDPNSFLTEHLDRADVAPDAVADIGHVHLKVGDLARTKEFYADVLGFEVTTGMPGALFVSAGGYHHHLGMNTWQSAGAGPRVPPSGWAKSLSPCPTATVCRAWPTGCAVTGSPSVTTAGHCGSQTRGTA